MGLRIVFAGTPEFAVPCLQALLAGPDRPLAVYTQPDRPAGRGRMLQASPVKQAALAAGLPVLQPESLRTAAARAELAAVQPDLLVVVAYGLILPPKILALPKLGCWNVHASLLPRWRGAAPIQRAIEAGDRETGVCLMQMEQGLDTGPVLLRLATPIDPAESAGALHDRLAQLGAEVLRDGLGLLRAGLRPLPQAQAEIGVAYAHKLGKAEAQLDWQQPATVLERKVRAYQPWPIAEAIVAGERLRIHAARCVDESGLAGQVLRAGRDGVVVAAGAGALCLERVQRDGGRVISAAEYANARRDLHTAPSS